MQQRLQSTKRNKQLSFFTSTTRNSVFSKVRQSFPDNHMMWLVSFVLSIKNQGQGIYTSSDSQSFIPESSRPKNALKHRFSITIGFLCFRNKSFYSTQVLLEIPRYQVTCNNGNTLLTACNRVFRTSGCCWVKQITNCEIFFRECCLQHNTRKNVFARTHARSGSEPTSRLSLNSLCFNKKKKTLII